MSPNASGTTGGIIFAVMEKNTMKNTLFLFLLVATTSVQAQKITPVLQKSMDVGKELYMINCQSCHMEQGEGLEGVFPPLAKSDYLMADKKRSILQIINGASGSMKVNGVTYEGEMQGYPLSDQEVADLLNYIRNSFGNKGGMTTSAEVAAARK